MSLMLHRASLFRPLADASALSPFLHFDFTEGQAWRDGASAAIADQLTCVRNSVKRIPNAAGELVTIAANALPITDLGLYPESAGENLLLSSQTMEIDNWDGNATREHVSGILAPDGTETVRKLTTIATGYGGGLGQWSDMGAGEWRTLSVFVKKINHRYIGLRFNSSVTGGNENVPFYDFDTDTLSANGVSGATLRRWLLANGWVRLALTYQTTDTNGSVQIWMTNASGQAAPAPAGGEQVYVWGAQYEVGRFPSSYIVNASTAVSATRAADVITLADNTGLSLSAGSFFAAFELPCPPIGRVFTIIDLGEDADEHIVLQAATSDKITAGTANDGDHAGAVPSTNAWAERTPYKAAFRYAQNNLMVRFSASLGADPAADTSCNVPDVDPFLLYIGTESENRCLDGWMTELSYYQEVLPESDLEGLVA